jgi:hypothetical protein
VQDILWLEKFLDARKHGIGLHNHHVEVLVEQLRRLVPVVVVAIGIVGQDAVGHADDERIAIHAVARTLDERYHLGPQRVLAEREILDRDDPRLQALELAYQHVAARDDDIPQFLRAADVEYIGVGVDAQRRQEHRLDVIWKFYPPGY